MEKIYKVLHWLFKIIGILILFWCNVVIRFKYPEWTSIQAILNQPLLQAIGFIFIILAIIFGELEN